MGYVHSSFGYDPSLCWLQVQLGPSKNFKVFIQIIGIFMQLSHVSREQTFW